MPVDWPQQGVYRCEMHDSSLWLFQNGSERKAKIRDPEFEGIKDVSEVSISKNYSDSDAKITRTGLLKSLSCVSLLAQQSSARGCKRGASHLALGDGDARPEPAPARIIPALVDAAATRTRPSTASASGPAKATSNF